MTCDSTGIDERNINMVLIIDRSKRKAQAISDIFYYMGVISCAATPTEALSEISGIYRSVLVIDPENLPDAEDFLSKLRSYNSSVPIFAISDAPSYSYPIDSFDASFKNDVYSSDLVSEIVAYQSRRHLKLTAHYRLAGIDASCDKETPTVFDKLIPFTKTEIMILRYLIASYPIPQSSKDVIKYAFKPSKKPEETSIRTHMSMMNKKFREIRNKNLFIHIPAKGYVILTPEIMKSITQASELTVS